MTSQLAAQLRILAGAGAPTTSRASGPGGASQLASAVSLSAIAHAAPGSTASKYKASFLFAADVAAATDSATIQSMGVSGMEQLAKLEPRLRTFLHSLCAASQFDRDAHTTQQIAHIHATVNQCIKLLAPFFMLKPTHKVLEFLIRRYNVHIYNISALLSAFLPYHESALFARLLQVLHIHLSVGATLPANEPNSNKLFGFLEGAQKEGSSSITRHTLVQRCMHDHAFLQWLVSLVAVKGAAQLSNTTITFYTTLMLELLTTLRGANNANHSEAKDAIARAIVQHALEVLNAHVNATAPAAADGAAKPTPAVAGPPRELVFSSLLLLSQAALVYPFGTSLEAALFLLLKSMPSARGEQTLAHPVAMALLALAQNQNVSSAPPTAVSALIASQGAEAGSPFVSTLANLSQQYDVAHLVQVLLPQLAAAHVGSERKHAHLLLSEMVSSLPLTESQVHTLVSTLLQSYVAAHREATDAVEWSPKEISSLRKLVLLIQTRYSTQLESVVQQVIEQANRAADNGAAAAADDAEMADASQSKKKKKHLKSSPLLSLIHLLFEGSAHEVLVGVQGQAAGAPQSASILTCLNSPLAHVRIQALQAVEQLDAAAIAADNNEGESSLATHLHSALLSKLSDAEPSVVRATLKLKSLVRLVPFDELVQALAGIFSRSASVIDLQSLTRSSNHKVLESALKLAAKMATAVWSDESTSLEQQAAQLHSLLHTLFPFLFELSLVRPSAGVTSKIARAAQSLMVLLASKAKHAALHPSAAGDDEAEQQNGFLLCALFAHMEAVPEAAENDLADDAAIRSHNQGLLAAWASNLVKIAGASSPLQLQQLAAIEDEIIGSLERVAASVGAASRSSNKIAGGRVDAPTTAFALLQLLNQTLQQLATSKKTEVDLFLRFARAQQKALAAVWGALTAEQRRAAYAASASSVSSSSALVAPSSFVSSASGSSLVPSSFPAFVRSSLALLVSVSSELVSTHRSDEDRARATGFVRELYGFFVSDSESVGAFGAHIALLCKQHLQGGGMQETVRFLLPLLHGSGSGVASSLQVSVRSFHLLHALLQNHASGKSKPNKDDATLLSELGSTFLLACASPARAVRHAALMAIPALCAALTPAVSADKKGAGSLVAALLAAMGSEKEELLAASSTDATDDDESLLESATDASLQHVQAFVLKTLGSDSVHGAFKSEAHRVELQKFLTVLALRLASAPESIASGWRLLQILRRLPHERTAEMLLEHLRVMLSKPIRTLAQMSVAVELLHQLDAAVVQKDTAAAFACLLQSLSLSVATNAEAMRDEEDDDDGTSSRQVVASIQQAALSRISTEVFELLSEEQQEQLFETLLRIHTAGQTAAAALVAQLPFDSSVFAKRLVHQAGGKSGKKSKSGSSVADVTAVLELLQLKGEPQHSLRSPFALVAPLFHLLEQLCAHSQQEAGSESSQLQSFEYSKQLTMSALTRFLAIPAEEAASASSSNSKKSKKAAASAGINVKDINVDAVVACLSASAVAEAPAAAVPASSPAAEAHNALHTLNVSLENTRSHALTLLSLIGKSHPELVVDKLVPIFQTLLVHSTDSNTKVAANAVSSAMEVEGQAADEASAADSEPYALRLLNQLISTVLPSIVQAKLHWNVWQLLGVFVESLTVRSASSVSSTAKSLLKKKAVESDSAHSSVVNRRRLHLFHNLLTSLQAPKEDGAPAADADDDNYLHIVVALLLAKSVIRTNTSNASVSSKQESAAYKASLQEFAHALCEQFGEEPVFQIRAFNSLLQLLGAEIESEHGELLASQQKNVGAPLRLGASSRSKKAAAASVSSDPALSPLASLLRTPAQISSWQKGVLSFLSQHLARLSFAQQIYLHAKRTQQTADDKDEIQTSFLHLFEHLFARLRSSLQLSKHLSTNSSSAALSNHFLLLSTHTKQALLHLNGLLTMPNFVRILQELFRISSSGGGAGGRRDVQLILQALSLLNSKLISYRDRAKLQSFGATKKAEEEGDEADADMSDPNSVERVAFFKNKKAEQRLLVSLLPALQQLLEVESVGESDAAMSSSSSNADVAAMKQSALLNLEMLTSSFGHMRQFQPEFVKLVSAVLKLITLPSAAEGKDNSAEVQATLHSHSWQHISTSALLCLATLVSSFHAKSHVLLLEFIPTMVPNTLGILQHINAPAPAAAPAPKAAKASKLAGKKRKHGEEEEEESDEEDEEPAALQTLDTLSSPLLQLSALSLLQACIQTVADLLSPYLADLLKVLLFPGYHNQAGVSSALSSLLAPSPMAPASSSSASSSSAAAPASAAAGPSSSVDHSSVSTVVTQSLTSLIELVPSRTLLPIIFSHYKIAAPQGYSSLRRLFQVLGLVVQQLKSDAVKQHFKLIFKFFLAAAHQLRKSTAVSGSDADAYGVTLSQAEDALIGSFLELIMKLNETSFKGLFLKMLQWVGPIPTAGSELLSGSGGAEGASSTAEFLNRSLVFFKLIHQVTLKLKGMFVSYFGYIMDHCVVFLNAPKKIAATAASAATSEGMEDEEEAGSEEEDDEDNETGSNKKHKQSDGSAAVSSKAASNQAALSGGIAGGVPSELIDLVLLSLRNCFLYDTQHFMDKYHFQLLTGPMVQQLQYAFTTRVGKSSAAGGHAHAAYDDFVTHTLTPTLVQLAIRMGNYLQWKPLVSAMLLHGRSPSPAVRRAAVYVFEQLFVSIGDNLLVIMPEMMPWIAEMLEDGDVGVERNVQKLVRIVEKMSGESLDATLQGAD